MKKKQWRQVLGRPLALPKPIDLHLFEVEEHILANGLKIRLLCEPTLPIVSMHTVYGVGSRNEKPGITGIAHLFEHMMFNGTTKYGPKEFDRLLESHGGSSNAYTTQDMTVYFEDFASESLELVLDLESDRMRFLSIDDSILASEREVIKEERRLSVENEIMGILDEELFSLAFQAHPYRWPVIGWMADIEAITKDDCLEFYRTYYAPNNATLWLAGKFDSAQALDWIQKYYGDIPAGPPLPKFSGHEPAQRGERKGEIPFPAHTTALMMGFKTFAASHSNSLVLDVIQCALCSGEGARLTKKLVYEEMLATHVAIDSAWRLDPGLLVLMVELHPRVRKTEKVIKLIEEELQRVCMRGFSEKELLRAKGQLRTQFLRSVSTNHGRACSLGTHEFLVGDWRSVLQVPEKYAAVTAADVQQVARMVFNNNSRTVVTLLPNSENKRKNAHK